MASLLDKVITAEQRPYYVKALIYGPGGGGKTTFAASAPNPVFEDVERSTESLRRNPLLKNTPLYVPDSFEDMYAFAREVVRMKAYETIVIDTIGRAQTNHISDYLETATKKPDGSRSRSQYLPLWGDFRLSTAMLDEFFVFLQNANIHVIFIAHDRVYMNEEGNVTRITPDLTPALGKSLRELVNVVAYMEAVTDLGGQTKRKMYLNSINKIEAKNRLCIKEITIENPTFEGVFLR